MKTYYKGWEIDIRPDEDSYLSRAERRWRGRAEKNGSVLQSAGFGLEGEARATRMLILMIDCKEPASEEG